MKIKDSTKDHYDYGDLVPGVNVWKKRPSDNKSDDITVTNFIYNYLTLLFKLRESIDYFPLYITKMSNLPFSVKTTFHFLNDISLSMFHIVPNIGFFLF